MKAASSTQPRIAPAVGIENVTGPNGALTAASTAAGRSAATEPSAEGAPTRATSPGPPITSAGLPAEPGRRRLAAASIVATKTGADPVVIKVATLTEPAETAALGLR